MSGAAWREDTELLLVDGDNLLRAVHRDRDAGAVAWLLPRLSRWRPAELSVIVALDGHPAPGESAWRRVAPGIELVHSGSRSADDLIIDLLGARPYSRRARTVVVTRDHALADRARRTGGLTRSVDWLIGRLEAGPGSRSPGGSARIGVGQGKPPRRSSLEAPRFEGDSPEPWRPGRGATRKRGNPRRNAKGSRQR
jgi:hypothetical protein